MVLPPMPTTPPPVPTFSELGLPEALVAHLAARSITSPTPVQAAVIPLALAGIGSKGGDLLAQARTGSGKTMAFLLPLATAFAAGECKRAWVVCPTRELAGQVAREAEAILGAGTVATLIGGAPSWQQQRDLQRKPPLIVGTPGRMCDMLQQKRLVADAEILVLDEADQMLDMGFKDELETLVKDLGEGVARWFFSATFPPSVEDAVERWLDKPREVRLDTRQASGHVPQKFVLTHRGHELAALVRLLQVLEPARALVFTRTRLAVDEVCQALALASIDAGGISGDLQQDARERVLSRFRQGKMPVLVATDVAARGLDVQGVSHVFNLGLPVGAASYTHRIGRTARAGALGEAWTVIAMSERMRFMRLAQSAGSRPTQAEVPSASEIIGARRRRLAVRVAESLGENLSLPTEFAELVAASGAEAVLAAIVHRLVPDAAPEPARPAPGARIDARQGGSVELFMGVGQDDGVTPASIIAMVCRGAEINNAQLGKLRMYPRHTTLAVAAAVSERVLGATLHYRGRRIPVRLDARAAPGARGNDGPRGDDHRPQPTVTPRPQFVLPVVAAAPTPAQVKAPAAPTAPAGQPAPIVRPPAPPVPARPPAYTPPAQQPSMPAAPVAPRPPAPARPPVPAKPPYVAPAAPGDSRATEPAAHASVKAPVDAKPHVQARPAEPKHGDSAALASPDGKSDGKSDSKKTTPPDPGSRGSRKRRSRW